MSVKDAYDNIKKDKKKAQEIQSVYEAYVNQLFPADFGAALMKIIPSEAEGLTEDDYRRAAHAAQIFCLGMTELYIQSESEVTTLSNLLSRAVTKLDLLNADTQFVAEATYELNKINSNK